MKSPAPSRPQKMALIPACIFLCFAALSVQAEETPVTPQPPDILLGPLFNDVQNAKLFPDQKTFADAVPNSDPLMILADYRMQQNQSGFDLRHFVNVNFTLPKEGEKYVPPEGQSLREHIDGLWPVLTRSTENTEKWDSLLPLPEPYVVPGGRFREVYYWDSYFTMLGLAESGHWDKVADMVANFAHEIDTYGHIPNGNRSYYLSRSQPPFFALMVELLAQHEGDAALKQYLPQMQKEYAYWMDGVENLQAGQQEKRVVKLQDGTLLNRYWDDRDTGAVDLRVTNAMFRNNIANDGKGGAIYTINNDVYLSDVIFDNNQAYTSTSYSDGDGGAIDVTDNNSDSKHPSGYTIINNTAFTNNTAEGYGGAIYTNSATAPYLIDISVDDSYSQNGGVLVDENNSAAGYGDGPSTAAGGFMYLGLSEVTFDIADGKTLVIGNTENDGAVDSIAGTGLITKTGSGDLVLNADNNDFTGEMQIENGEVTLGRSNSLMNVGDTHCQDDPQDCYGLTIGSIDKYQNQAELNVGSTQQTFVHSLTGFQNGTLNIDAGGNVTVNQGS
ncbi:alpha,alpha-trehalase TreA, partial [Escherichia sp. HC-TM1]